MQRKLLGIINVDFDATGQLLIIHSAFVKYFRKNGNKQSSVSALYRLQETLFDLVRREDLYNILTEFGIPMKLVRLIKMCMNETYSTVWIGKHLSDMLPDHCLSTLKCSHFLLFIFFLYLGLL